MDKIEKLAQNRQNGKNDEIRQTTFIAPIYGQKSY